MRTIVFSILALGAVLTPSFASADTVSDRAAAVTLCRTQVAQQAGVDLVSVSTGQTVAHQQPRHGRMWQMPFAELLKKRLGLTVMGVGAVTTSGQVNALLHAGKADLVALGRPWLADPFWMRRQAALDGVSLPGSPAAYAAGWEQVERQARQPR